jgi:hypothetical protein
MTMKIAIRNFMGCETADITASPIALVSGQNAQGKSSVCRAVAFALAGHPVPVGMTKNAASALVRVGAPKGRVEVTSDTGTVTIDYPKALLASDGANPPRASVWAAGIKSVVDLPERERVEVLRDLIGAKPTFDDLVQAATEAGIDARHFEPMWKTIELNGWDAAHKQAGDKGREIKAQWEYATGEKYGEKKAESWIPRNWSTGIENASKEALEAVVTGARAEVELAIANAAVDASRITELQALATQASDLIKQAEEQAGVVADWESDYNAEQAILAKLPQGKERQPLCCPHCQGQVFPEKHADGVTRLIKASGMTPPEDLVRQAEKYAEQLARVEDLRSKVTQARNKLHQLDADAAKATGAAKTLAEMPRGTASQADIDKAREAQRLAEGDLQAFVKKSEADRLHRSALVNQLTVALLSPDGVRRRALVKALEGFNTAMAEISASCKWKPVSISPDLDVEYNGRPYFLLSESEQFRARTTLQLAIAAQEGAAAIVIDGADVLDNAGRSGLFNHLRKHKITALIGMMSNSRDKVPNMAEAKCGATYWIENGICEGL